MQKVGTTNPIPHHDEDINMQLEAVTPKHGGSSLQLSILQECVAGYQVQTANKIREKNLIWHKTPPLHSPTKVQEWETQTTLIAPRGERREETNEQQPHTLKIKWGLTKPDLPQGSNP